MSIVEMLDFTYELLPRFENELSRDVMLYELNGFKHLRFRVFFTDGTPILKSDRMIDVPALITSEIDYLRFFIESMVKMAEHQVYKFK